MIHYINVHMCLSAYEYVYIYIYIYRHACIYVLFIYLSLYIYIPKFKNTLSVEEGAHIELWLHKYIVCVWKPKDNLRF